MTRKPKDMVPLQVRMPEELRKKLKRMAAQDRRSMNAEIIWRLERSVNGKK